MSPRGSRHLKPRRRRTTPRRWPALVAIPALLIGAGILDRGHLSRQRPERIVGAAIAADPARLLPTASPASALSSTWFCAGGTARGPTGPAELSVAVANRESHSAIAEISVFDDAGGMATKQVNVPALGRLRVLAADIHKGRWVSAMVEVFGTEAAVDRVVTGPDGYDVGPCSSSSSNHWYFAEGSTLRGSNQYLALFNPFPDDASVDIHFATEDGERRPRELQGFQVPGRSLRMIRITDLVSRRATVATSIISRSGNVVADRVQLFDGSGDPTTGPGTLKTVAPRGLVVSAGAPQPARTWLFPDGRKIEGSRSQIWVYNPGSADTTADITVTLDDPQRNGVLDPFPIQVPAGEVRVFDITGQSTIPADVGQTISVRSRGQVPVVAEQLLSGGKPWGRRGVGVTLGAPAVAGTWIFPAGNTTPQQSDQIVVSNPGPARATVSIQVLATGRLVSSAKVRSVVVPGRGHVSFDLAAFGLNDVPVVVTSTGRVVASQLLLLTDHPGLSLALGLPVPATVSAPPPA